MAAGHAKTFHLVSIFVQCFINVHLFKLYDDFSVILSIILAKIRTLLFLKKRNTCSYFKLS